MRNILLAAVAAAALATPALARDGAPYVGIEGGIVLPEDFKAKLDIDPALVRPGQGFIVDFKKGLDADVLAGYDFGSFRLEGELGYKRLRTDRIRLDSGLATDLGLPDTTVDGPSGSVWSLMANGILDFGNEDGLSGFVGIGAGRARVKMLGDRDSAMAYQVVAGVRHAISSNIDVGLKYRYFRTGKLNYGDDFDDGTDFAARGKLRTHSLLASLIFNFGAPPAPVVVAPVVETPPPPPPATQTCYDGSVILATDVCPQPPVETPPPPPAPVPERG